MEAGLKTGNDDFTLNDAEIETLNEYLRRGGAIVTIGSLGGMGVHLARTLTDRLDHRILPTGGNEVTVRRRRRVKTGEASDGHHDRPTQP